MKKIILVVACFIVTTVGAQAQKKAVSTSKSSAGSVKAPASIVDSLNMYVPDVKSKSWKKNYSGNFIATYTTNAGIKGSAEFKPDGSWVSIKETIKSDDLPEAVTNAIQSQYPDFTASEIVKTTLPSINPYYKMKIKSADNQRFKEILVSEEGSIAE